jgi:cytochrome P450
MRIRVTFHDLSLSDLSNHIENIMLAFKDNKSKNISLVHTTTDRDSVFIIDLPDEINIQALQKEIKEIIGNGTIDIKSFMPSIKEEELIPIGSEMDFHTFLSGQTSKNQPLPKNSLPRWWYLKRAYELSPVNLSLLTGYRYINVPRLIGNPFWGKLDDILSPDGMFKTTLEAGKLAAQSPRKVSSFWLGSKPVFFLSEPKDVVQTLWWRDAYIKRYAFPNFDQVFDTRSFFILHKDDYWKETRNAAKHQFFTKNALSQHADLIQETIQSFLDEIQQGVEDRIDLVNFFNRFSVNLIGRISLQVKNLPAQVKEFSVQAETIIGQMFNTQSQIALSLPEWLRKIKFPGISLDSNNIKKKISATNKELIFNEANKEMLNNPKGLLNLASQFYNKYRNHCELDPNVPHTPTLESVDGIITLFFGALYSTSTTLLFSFKLINKHPEVKEKLFEELAKTNKIDVHNIDELSYLDCVIKEVMRLYPPNFLIIRKIDKDFDLIDSSELKDINNKIEFDTYFSDPNRNIANDVRLYQDDLIMYSPYLIHRLPSVWKYPEEFRPERFMNFKPAQGTYMPFGIGTQDCLGQKLVLKAMKLMLALTLKQYHLQIENNDDLTLESNAIAIKLKNPVHGRFVKNVENKDNITQQHRTSFSNH